MFCLTAKNAEPYLPKGENHEKAKIIKAVQTL